MTHQHPRHDLHKDQRRYVNRQALLSSHRCFFHLLVDFFVGMDMIWLSGSGDEGTLPETKGLSTKGVIAMFIEVDTLTSSVIRSLADGKILAVRVKGFYPESLCKDAAKAIKNFNTTDYYAVTKDIGIMKKIGPAIFDYAESTEKVADYYRQVPKTKEVLNNIFNGWNPLDRVRNEVNICWKQGCVGEELHDQEMYYGLVRVFENGSFALPHQDMTHWDMPNCENAQTIKKQFAVNVHLQTPEIGGQIIVYNKSIRDQSEYNARKIQGTYGLRIDDIPLLEQVCIKPSAGDLIISNSQMIHAVLENQGTFPRYTTSCFINYRGDDKPLRMFS